MKHTKGKWTYTDEWEGKHIVYGEDSKRIAITFNVKKGILYPKETEAEANANVIAKVPEMIEALKNVYRLRNIILPPAADIKVEHQDEVTAIYQAIKKIESLLKELES